MCKGLQADVRGRWKRWAKNELFQRVGSIGLHSNEIKYPYQCFVLKLGLKECTQEAKQIHYLGFHYLVKYTYYLWKSLSLGYFSHLVHR